MRPNQVMFIYKPQLKDVKSRKETTLQISARNTNSRKIAANTVFSVLGNSDVQRVVVLNVDGSSPSGHPHKTL